MNTDVFPFICILLIYSCKVLIFFNCTDFLLPWFIYKYFILLNTMVKGFIFLISFSDYLLLM